MSKLTMWNVISLDGCFEGAKSWDLSWHQLILGDEFERLAIDNILRSADRLLFGRVTYEGMAAYWQTAKGAVAEYMNSLPKIVFSRTLSSVDWANTRLVKDSAVAEVEKLKRDGEKNSFIFGSGNLCQFLIERNLFDEYRLLVAPVILGTGKLLFPSGIQRENLKLLEERRLSSGGIYLRYEPAR